MFVGVEGKSDRAFVRFLGLICDEAGLHLHLDAKDCSGGDSLAVVEETARQLRHHPDPRGITTRLVLLDLDRRQQDLQAGRDALAKAKKHHLQTVLFDPNLEGLLVRLHEGHERRRIHAADASGQLKRLWPTYAKSSLTAHHLKQRFSLGDLERAAKHDAELLRLLSILELAS